MGDPCKVPQSRDLREIPSFAKDLSRCNGESVLFYSHSPFHYTPFRYSKLESLNTMPLISPTIRSVFVIYRGSCFGMLTSMRHAQGICFGIVTYVYVDKFAGYAAIVS